MKYRRVSERLIRETKAMMRLHYFLRHECGLKYADNLSAPKGIYDLTLQVQLG